MRPADDVGSRIPGGFFMGLVTYGFIREHFFFLFLSVSVLSFGCSLLQQIREEDRDRNRIFRMK